MLVKCHFTTVNTLLACPLPVVCQAFFDVSWGRTFFLNSLNKIIIACFVCFASQTNSLLSSSRRCSTNRIGQQQQTLRCSGTLFGHFIRQWLLYFFFVFYFFFLFLFSRPCFWLGIQCAIVCLFSFCILGCVCVCALRSMKENNNAPRQNVKHQD